MYEHQFEKYYDWGLLCIVFMLAVIGFITLYSAVNAGLETTNNALCVKQMVWYLVGLSIMGGSLFFNYKLLDRWGAFFYAFCIILLICVLVYGKYVGGSKRWLVLGPITFQPSELVKIGVIIILARYYAKNTNVDGLVLRDLLAPIFYIALPFVLIVKQPDLGTAMLLVLVAATMTLFVKIERRMLIYILFSCTIAGPLVWFLLKGYQKQRILTFLNPDRDPLGAGYHIIQSKIAIGSGMLFGKGYLKGTQNALSFLPEQHTDFILSVLAEEWGFVGSGILLLFYFLLIFWGLNIANKCREPFGTILAVGVTTMIFWQVFINIGMVMGLMPVVGVPLPLISYGGSSVVTTLIGIAILMNVSMRRYMVE